MRTDLAARMRPVLAIPLALAGTPASAAAVCTFETECYQTEACTNTSWELTVDLDAGTLSSVAEDLEIVMTDDNGSRIVAEGANSLNLLTIGETASLFTAHIAGEPTVVSYVGECRAQ